MRLKVLLGILLAFAFVGCTHDEPKPTDPVSGDKVIVVHFEFNKNTLDDAQKKIISDAVAQKTENTKVVIVGHTDSQGSKEYNQKLSETRAKEVSDYLKTLKVESTFTGAGEEKLLNKDLTKADHKANRRAEITFTVTVK